MQQLGWDNYQHLYPSACDDDDEEEEKLDLQWDEQMEASINVSFPLNIHLITRLKKLRKVLLLRVGRFS